MNERDEHKKEKDDLWQKLREEYEKTYEARQRRKQLEKPLESTARRDERGKVIVKYVWGQELPASETEATFWERHEKLDQALGEVDEYVDKAYPQGPLRDAARTMLTQFVSHVRALAQKKHDDGRAERQRLCNEYGDELFAEWMEERSKQK